MNKCPINGMPCPLPRCVHITDIGKDYKAESTSNLCLLCALPLLEEYLGEDDAGPSVPGLTKQFKALPKPVPLKTKTCEECGFAIEDLLKSSKLGCPNCYKCFKKELIPLIKVIHRATKHKGKKPKNVDKETKLKSLKLELEKAIKEENYELAGELKDKIKNLEEG